MYGLAHIVYFLIALLICLIGVWHFEKKSQLTRTIIFFTVFILGCDCLSVFLAFVKLANYKLLFAKLTLSTLFLIHIVREEIVDKRFLVAVKISVVLLLMFTAFVMMLPIKPGEWPAYPFLVCQVIWIVYTLVAMLLQLQKDDPSPLWRRAYFWFMGGSFCFYCFSFLLFPMRSTGVSSLVNSQLHNTLIIYGCIFLYSLIAAGLLLDKNQSSSTYV